MNRPDKLPARNEPCWCGSGKKYKKCHYRDDQQSVSGPALREDPDRILLKTPEQIAGIRRAGALTTEILDKLNDVVAPGVTTGAIDKWIFDYLKERNATPATLGYKGYPASCCTSLNEVICHGIPGPRVLKDGDILNVDVTSIVDGYYGDACRMYLVGEVSPEAQRLVEVTRECLQRSVAAVRPGATLGDVGHAIQSHAEANGYSVVRDFVGHGVGMRFHEPPQVFHYGRPGTGTRLQENMTFTIEPMINAGDWRCKVLDDGWTAVTADGSLSAQWEHTLVVTADGADILAS